MIRIKMKGLKYTLDEVEIDISPEGMDALNAKDVGSGFFSSISAASVTASSAEQSEPADEVQEHEEEQAEYITINQWNQQNVPPEYGAEQPVMFRKPTQDEIDTAEIVFHSFLAEWCAGWGVQPNDRLKLIHTEMKASNNRLALHLKWCFYTFGSIQKAVQQALLAWKGSPVWEQCFGRNTEYSDDLVVDVANNMCQIFSAALPELTVFFNHQWYMDREQGSENE